MLISGHCVLFSLCTDYMQLLVHIVDSQYPVINPCAIFTKMDNWERKLANKDESAAKK